MEHFFAVVHERNNLPAGNAYREIAARNRRTVDALRYGQRLAQMGFGFRLGFLQNELVKALHIARLAPAFRGFVAIGNGQHDFFAFGEFVFGIGDDEIGFRKRCGVELRQYAAFNRFAFGFHRPADFHIGKVRKQVFVFNRIGLRLRVFFHRFNFRINFFHFVIRGVGFAVGADNAVCAEIGVAAGHSCRVRQL